VANPRILRLSRPSESVDEYITSEGWSISTKRMILIDQPRLEKDTVVRFEVSLKTGEKLIRAEARVVGYQAPNDGRPGGPKVRFKRFGGTTKSFIQQVASGHGPVAGLDTMLPQAADTNGESVHPPALSAAPRDADDSNPANPRLDADDDDDDDDDDVENADSDSPSAGRTNLEASPEARERLKQLRQNTTPVVSAPPNRESLLERLRERSRRQSAAGAGTNGAEYEERAL
jgi:hypothetical protein